MPALPPTKRAQLSPKQPKRPASRPQKSTQNAIFGRCCMNPDKFRNTNALKRGASREEVSRLHDELARGAPVLERLIADGLANRFPTHQVDILNWKEMLKRAQDLQLKLRKRLNQRAARSSAAPAMAEERQEESWAPMEALREKREALRQRASARAMSRRWPRSRGGGAARQQEDR